MSMYGTPGPVYIDLPGDLLLSKADASTINYLPLVEEIPALIVPQDVVSKTLQILRSAKSPLVIVGKGVAYGNAEKEMREFIEKSNLPFLATPMGKGIVKDSDVRSVGSARTFVLKNADVVFLVGARLNWILHFGEAPRFKKGVKIIQLDNDPLEINTNIKSEIALCGEAKPILS
jgi:2-hydroxyacyl-CoA lyase 1